MLTSADMSAPARRATPLIVLGLECRPGRRSFAKGREAGRYLRLRGPLGHDTTTGDDGTCVPAYDGARVALDGSHRPPEQTRNVLQPLRWTPAWRLCRAETIKKLTT